MSSYKNPSTLTIASPVNVDAEIQRLRDVLAADLAWLDKSFGKAEMARTNEDGVDKLYPEVYTGETRKPYQNVLPNNKLKSQSFFKVNEPLLIADSDTTGGMMEPNTFILNLGVIFWFDLHKISKEAPYTGLGYRFTEVLLGEVLQSLRLAGVKVKEVFYTPSQVFAGYTVNHLEQQELKQPYSGFRVEIETSFLETCLP